MITGIFVWKRYILTVLGMTGFIDLNTYLPATERILPSSDIVYQKTIEGFNWDLRNPLEYYLDNTSLYDVLNALDIPDKRDILPIGFAITMIFLSLYIFKYLFKSKNISHIFLFGVVASLITDFFIPVGRYSYYDIQMILPLLIIICQTNTKYLIGRKSNIFLISGLFLSVIGFVIIPRALFFSVFLIMFYILQLSFQLANNKERKSTT